MSNPRLAKLRKQPDSTWALLQKRLISLPDPFQTLFPDDVWSFIQKKADSLSTNAGYVATCLLTTTSFVGGLGATLTNGSQEMPLNLYSIFVGPPTTGKSQALKECAASPMSAVAREQDSSSYIINNCTSSGLIKAIAQNEKGYLLSAEIYDVLFKLLKSDEENATGDVQVLCQLFSGEGTSFRYATERTREIAENTTFSILGSTQVPFAARLITVLDQGHGLLDRFLITFPKCLRPTPTQTDQAMEYLSNLPLSSCDDIFIEIARLHSKRTTYSLSDDARHLVNLINEEFIAEVNAAISEGRSPPKTKKVDIVLRVAVSLHIFNAVANKLIKGEEPTIPEQQIDKSTVVKAISYVSWAESQKEIFVEVRYYYMVILLHTNHLQKPNKQNIPRFCIQCLTKRATKEI